MNDILNQVTVMARAEEVLMPSLGLRAAEKLKDLADEYIHKVGRGH